MRVMDDSTQDDECSIVTVTPPKKKKMKQARLPFQMLSSLESANKVPNKKRKLTSPLIECKSSKMIKITTKENSIENVDEAEVNGDVSNRVNESNSSVEILTDVEVEESIESKTSEDKEVQDNNETPKRSSRRSKRAKSKDNGTAGALTKFFKKTEKNLDIIGNHQNDSIQHKEIDEIQDKTLNVRAGDTVSESKNSQNEKREESNEMINDVSKCFDTDSDDTLSSSENEEKEEQEKSNTTMDNVRNATTSTPKTEDSLENAKRRKLTPKQLERRKESAKKREEKEKLRMEKEKKREEERENRRKEKEEKEKAEKEQKKKERELKELKKQMKIEQKQKEKEAKEEERRKKEEAKEEEKRKKEEEKQEVERKKQKAASNFASFFVAKKQESKCAEEENVIETRNFMPFEVKADMKVAPICRRVISDKEKSLLDERCHKGNAIRSELYIAEIKNKKFELRKSTKTWPLEAKDEVIVVDEENDDTSNIVDETHDTEKQRPKLLQFAENRRPPYWGTWRKQSSCVQSRRPFSKDTKWFDYEVDSDDEWEEEEPGESLHGSEDERDEENPEDNEYDVDNEFMVPHGYLSDEEALADEEEKEDMTPETQKFKLKILGEQFEAERNAKTSKLKPKIIGCIWQGAENTFPENTPSKTVEFLLARQAWVRQIPITLPSVSESENATSAECTTPTHQQVNGSTRKKRVPNEALPDLLRLIHGNVHGRNFLAKEFMAYWASKGEHQISKASLLQKIRELAKWTACPEERFKNKSCWYVSADTRRQYLPENEELTLPNCWTYTLEPKRKSDVLDISERSEKEEKDKEKKSVPLITQFTKKITQEEMKKQLSVKPTNVTPSKPPLPKTPKRATLISVPRGEQFPKSSRDSLFPKITIKEKVPNKYVNSKTNAQDTDKVTIVEHAEAVKASKSEGNPGINDKKSESDRNMKKKVGKKAKKNLQKVLPGISISTNADAKNNKDARNVDKADIIEVSDHDE